MLKGDIKAEACVIGGGLAGLSCALLLRQAGVETVLLEAGRVGHGVSGHTTAKITLQQGLQYSKLTRLWGKDAAANYVKASQGAFDALSDLALSCDCGYHADDSYLYTRKPLLLPKLQAEARAAKAAGLPMALCAQTPLPFPVSGALRLPKQAAFHPVKYMQFLCDKLSGAIFENTRALRIEHNRVYTRQGSVTAKNIVIATHFPFVNTPGYYFLRQYQRRGAVLALLGAPIIPGMYLALEETGLTIRCQEDVMIFGQSGGFRCGTQEKRKHYDELLKRANTLFPKAKPIALWSAQDCMPPDELPFIGPYAPGLPGIYVATGFREWGMLQSMLSAQIITGEITGMLHPQAAMFSPARRKLPGLLKLLGEDIAMAGHYLVGAPQFGCPVCTHLGCRLQFNREEQTWDCPAHGSRFAKDGDIMDGPAIHRLPDQH